MPANKLKTTHTHRLDTHTVTHASGVCQPLTRVSNPRQNVFTLLCFVSLNTNYNSLVAATAHSISTSLTATGTMPSLHGLAGLRAVPPHSNHTLGFGPAFMLREEEEAARAPCRSAGTLATKPHTGWQARPHTDTNATAAVLISLSCGWLNDCVCVSSDSFKMLLFFVVFVSRGREDQSQCRHAN